MLVEQEQSLVRALQECMIVCNHCLNECLAEDQSSTMIDCIRTDRECLEFCAYLEQAIIRQSPYAKELAEICMRICEDCARECQKHDHKHCQYCAEVCLQCMEACKTYLKN